MEPVHTDWVLAKLRYSIFDPTGNITALVESEVPDEDQPSVGRMIMAAHPEVEQVGFVRYALSARSAAPVQGKLRMAGGEFCGNATMCAAALWYLRTHPTAIVEPVLGDESTQVVLDVSGATQPVVVHLDQKHDNSFAARVLMPQATAIEDVGFSFGGVHAVVPVVRMPGITHAIIDESSAFFWLRDDHAVAERAARTWCASLDADGLGLMLVNQGDGAIILTPLVFIPGSDTVFWENSCASGSSAVGMYQAASSKAPVDITLSEPGGILRVISDPLKVETWLYGTVRLCPQSIHHKKTSR